MQFSVDESHNLTLAMYDFLRDDFCPPRCAG